MNRDIKFRGQVVSPKDKENGHWIYGNLIQRSIKNKDIIKYTYQIEYNHEFFNSFNGLLAVDIETVGQCTGLPDIDKNILYEGDICEYFDSQWGNRYKFKIEYLESRFITCLNNGSYGELKDMFHLNKYESIKKIGNIYDNPELFEEVTNE